jgi:signal peptidase II
MRPHPFVARGKLSERMNIRSYQAAAVLLVVAGDQLTKLLASATLSLHQSRMVIPNLFSLTLVHNNGMAFGIMSGSPSFLRSVLLTALSAAALLLILYYCSSIPRSRVWLQSGLSLIMGGALGNIIDRLRLQYVVDFLDFHWQGHSWPAFNLADSCITIGMGMLILDFVLGVKRRGRDRTV